MFNHNRGLWGYTGAAADGEPLTIRPRDGRPERGDRARGAVRCWELGGPCASERAARSRPASGSGDLVAATEAFAADGTSRALGAGPRVAPDPGLLAALARGRPTAV